MYLVALLLVSGFYVQSSSLEPDPVLLEDRDCEASTSEGAVRLACCHQVLGDQGCFSGLKLLSGERFQTLCRGLFGEKEGVQKEKNLGPAVPLAG